MESKTSTRIEWLDIAKGIAAFLVILGHTVSNESPIRALIFSFHMPLFFILAGYTFRQKQWSILLKSSLKRLALPYVLMVLVWNVPHFLMAAEAITVNGIADIVLTAIFASGTFVPRLNINAVGMSWFLMSLFFSRMIFNGILTVANKSKNPIAWSFLACLGSFCIGKVIGSHLGIYLPFSFDVSLVSTLFMWFGYHAKRYAFGQKSKSLLPGLTSCVIWLLTASFSSLEMAARVYTPSVLSIVAALSGTYLVCWLSMQIVHIKKAKMLRPIYKGMLFCGENAMGIYCFHALDWWIPWSSLPSFAGIPFSNFFKSIIRFAYSLSYCKLMSLLR